MLHVWQGSLRARESVVCELKVVGLYTIILVDLGLGKTFNILGPISEMTYTVSSGTLDSTRPTSWENRPRPRR